MDKQMASVASVDPENPWPGLYAYTEDQANYFHGREAETDELHRCVSQKILTVFFGQSGLGKSSLLQAGLFPVLRKDHFRPILIRFTFSKERHDSASSAVTTTALEQTRRALTRELFLAPDTLGLSDEEERWEFSKKYFEHLHSADRRVPSPPQVGETLWSYFHRDQQVFRDDRREPYVPVLVFDQFEELFTTGSTTPDDRAQVGAFLQELADLVEDRAPLGVTREHDRNDAPRYRVLLTLREDYLAHLESWCAEMPSLYENRLRLAALDGFDALEAIAKPASLRPGREPVASTSLSRRLVRFLAGEASATDGRQERSNRTVDFSELTVDPALLSLVLRRLNDLRVEKKLGQITTALLEEQGDVDGVLRTFYRETVTPEDIAVRILIEDELVTESGFRDTVSIERAETFLRTHSADTGAIERLIHHRLLRVEERLEQRRLEVAHDVLCRILLESRQERRAAEGVARDRQREAEVLKAAESAREAAAAELARETSRRNEADNLRMAAERARTNARRLTVVTGLGAVAAVAMLLVAIDQTRQADRAELEATQQKQLAISLKTAAQGLFLGLEEDDDPNSEPLPIKFGKAVENYANLVKNDTDIQTRLALSAAYSQLARLHREGRKFSDEIDALIKSIDPVREVSSEGIQLKVAQKHSLLGKSYANIEDFKSARYAYSKALTIREKLLQTEPENADRQFGVVVSLITLSSISEKIATKDGDPTQLQAALVFAEKAEAIAKKLSPKNPKFGTYADGIKNRVTELKNKIQSPIRR